MPFMRNLAQLAQSPHKYLFFPLITLLLDSILKIALKSGPFSHIIGCFLLFFLLLLSILLTLRKPSKKAFSPSSTLKIEAESPLQTPIKRPVFWAKYSKQAWALMVNLLIVVVFLECEVKPFPDQGGLFFTEGLKLGLIHSLLLNRLDLDSFRLCFSLFVALYANFRLLGPENWLQNAIFLIFLMIFVLLSRFSMFSALKTRKFLPRVNSTKNNEKAANINHKTSTTLKESMLKESNSSPMFPFPAVLTLLKKTHAAVAVLDSCLMPLFSSSFLKALFAGDSNPDLYIVQTLKFKLFDASPSFQGGKTLENSIKTSPTGLKQLLADVLASKEENMYLKLASKGLPARVIYVIKFSHRKSQFLAIFSPENSQNQAEIDQISQNHSRVLSFVAHEFRTPLNCINGMLQCLEEQVPTAIAEQYIQPSLSSSRHLMNMLQDILDLTQIKAGKFRFNHLDFDIALLLKDIFSLFQVQSRAKKLALSFEISPSVPKTLNTDPNRLKQVIINLVSNAFKYTQKGEITLFCELYGQRLSEVKISVKDTGLGIKEDDKPRLLQAFGRVEDQTNRDLNPQGVGLGLIISQDIAKRLAAGLTQVPEAEKGLHFESEYLKGSVFSFVFENRPLQNDKRSEEAEEINTFPENEQTCTLENNFESLKKQEKSKKFIEKRVSQPLVDNTPFFPVNSRLKTNPKVPSRFSLYHAPTVKEIVCQVSFGREDDNPKNNSRESLKKASFGNFSVSESRIFRGFSQLGIKSLQPGPSAPMSLLSDLSISFSSNSRSVSDPQKLQEIKERLEGSMRRCCCPEVLIVDDDPLNILALQFLIESLNLTIETATSGSEALIKLKDMNQEREGFCCRYYRIVFLDVEMPGKDGVDTCREMKEFLRAVGGLKETKIVACTGYNDVETSLKIREAGFDSHLTKPVLKGTLLGVMAEYLGVGRLEKKNN